MDIPSSWAKKQENYGLHVRGSHGDFFVRHTPFGAHELSEAVDQVLSNDKNYSEESREDTGFSIVSTGYYGRAYRELVFMVNSQSEISIFTFSANPDFLEEYTSVFEIIKSSIQFTNGMITEIKKDPTPALSTATPTSVPVTPLPTATITPKITATPITPASGLALGATPVQVDPSKYFEPLSPEKTTEMLTHILWTGLPVVRTKPGSDFTGIGTDSLSIDQRQEARDIFETGYYLLTGNSIPEKFVYELNTVSDFKAYGPPENAVGFCCKETVNQLLMPINAENKFSKVLGIMSHEAGHGRHRIENNEPFGFQGASGTTEGKTVKEAVAMSFGAAIIRSIGDYSGLESRNKPSKYRMVTIFDTLWKRWLANVDNMEEPHDRARVLLWVSILKDPHLSHLKQELQVGSHLSPGSLLELTDYLGDMSQTESIAYASEYLTADNLEELKSFLKTKITSRNTTDTSEGLLDSNWEAWLVP